MCDLMYACGHMGRIEISKQSISDGTAAQITVSINSTKWSDEGFFASLIAKKPSPLTDNSQNKSYTSFKASSM